jgi:thiol-disulfide isomerase/thioredoxin
MLARCSCTAVLVLDAMFAAMIACKQDPVESSAVGEVDEAVAMVGYDVRRLRPRNEEPLSKMFDRVRAQARADGKQVVVYFSADWCEACRPIALELGNVHPADAIDHIRVIELNEEEWEQVTRMNEYNGLRSRWYPILHTYPLFILLDESGQKVEEMREAKERLEGMGVEATILNWFQSVRPA